MNNPFPRNNESKSLHREVLSFYPKIIEETVLLADDTLRVGWATDPEAIRSLFQPAAAPEVVQPEPQAEIEQPGTIIGLDAARIRRDIQRLQENNDAAAA